MCRLIRILIAVVMIFGFSLPCSTESRAGFWETVTEHCRALFFKHPAQAIPKVRLPAKFGERLRILHPVQLLRFKNELKVFAAQGVLQPELARLIPRVENQAQYELVKCVAGKRLSLDDIQWIQKNFNSFRYAGQSVLLGQMVGGRPLKELDPNYLATLFGVWTVDQAELFHIARNYVNVGGDEYFRSEGIPRVSNSFQKEGMRIIMQHRRGEERDLINSALMLTNKYQLKGFESAVDRGLSGVELDGLLKVGTSEQLGDYLNFLKGAERSTDDLLERSEVIVANRDPQFSVSYSGYVIPGEWPVESLGAVKFDDKNSIRTRFFPTVEETGFELSADASMRNWELRRNRLASKAQNEFVYSIFNREAKRREKFESGFIHYLKDEDRILPYERIGLFEIRNSQNNVIGVFGLFDASKISGFADDTLPFLRKRSHLKSAFDSQMKIWERELGNKPRVFEVRRLALHPGASQLDVLAVVRIIRSRLESLGIADRSVVIAHTDHAGDVIFRRKAKMHSLYSPNDLKAAGDEAVPDEVVLFAKVQADWLDSNL